MQGLAILVRAVAIGLILGAVALVAFTTWAIEHLRFVIVP